MRNDSMVFTPKEWKFSNYEPKIAEFKTPTEGRKYLRIISAELKDDIKMKIIFKTLDDEDALFSVWYTLMNSDMSFNDRSLGSLTSLGYACCGVKTALLPEDLIGCVVIGDIKLAANKDPERPPYVNIYHYEPIDSDVMYLSDRQDQFYIPSEDEEGYEDDTEEEGPEE